MVDFSGVWVLNLDKSLLQSPAPDSSIFIINHSGQTFSLDRTHVINGMSDRFAIELETDGTTVKMDLRGIAVSAKMYWDGDRLVFDSVFQQGTDEAANIVRYSITDEGKSLVAEEDFISKDHKHHNIWVFDKQ